MFWGSTKLKRELPSLISDFHPDRVDGAAYRLRVGTEVYVSPTGEPGDERNKTKTILGPGGVASVSIAPGQFGFILTYETVKIPHDKLAFISIRARYKFVGLVNVSGFHVDPAFDGKLLFSVFNAGPNPVHIDYEAECFLIWYADLAEAGDQARKAGYKSIPFDYTGPLANGTQSFASLESKIRDNDKKVTDRVTTLEREQAVLKWGFAVAMGILVTVGMKQCSFDRPADENNAAVSNITDNASGSTVDPVNSSTNAGNGKGQP